MQKFDHSRLKRGANLSSNTDMSAGASDYWVHSRMSLYVRAREANPLESLCCGTTCHSSCFIVLHCAVRLACRLNAVRAWVLIAGSPSAGSSSLSDHYTECRRRRLPKSEVDHLAAVNWFYERMQRASDGAVMTGDANIVA